MSQQEINPLEHPQPLGRNSEELDIPVDSHHHLHVRMDGEGKVVVLLHGFTGSTQTLSQMASALKRGFRVVRIDLPGHGRSSAPTDLEFYRMHTCVRNLATVCDRIGVASMGLFGYSMGGRVALSFSTRYPEKVYAVATVGASAGIEDRQARDQRRLEDEKLARTILKDGIESFVDGWMAHPLFATQQKMGEEFLTRARAQRLLNRPQGLANSLIGMGTGTQSPVHLALETIGLPFLLLAGEEDHKFRSIAVELKQRMKNAEIEWIKGAGHAAHLEASRTVHDILFGFFQDHQPRSTSTVPSTK